MVQTPYLGPPLIATTVLEVQAKFAQQAAQLIRDCDALGQQSLTDSM